MSGTNFLSVLLHASEHQDSHVLAGWREGEVHIDFWQNELIINAITLQMPLPVQMKSQGKDQTQQEKLSGPFRAFRGGRRGPQSDSINIVKETVSVKGGN